MQPTSETAMIKTSSMTGQDKEKPEEIPVDRTTDEETVQTTPSSALTFPEGGFDAWKTVFGAWLIQYTGSGYVNSFGTFEDYYVREYLTHYSPSDIGWIGGVQVFLYFFVGAVAGHLFDKGYFTHLLVTTLILNSLGLFMLSITHENSYYQVFLSHGVTLGLATGLTYVPSFSIAGHYFQRRRVLAVGIIASGSALVMISAGINTFLLIIAVLITRTRLPPKATQRFPVGQWFKEPAYICVLISYIFLFFGFFYPIFYIQLNAVTNHVNKTIALYTTSILNAASLFGRIAPGVLAPRLGTYNVGIFMMVCTGVLVFCLLAVKDAAGTIVFSIFYGFFSGATVAMAPATVAALAKTPAEIGTRMGIVFAVGGLIGLFASSVSGALLTEHYLWLRPDIFAGVMLLAASALYLAARYFYGKGKATWRM